MYAHFNILRNKTKIKGMEITPIVVMEQKLN